MMRVGLSLASRTWQRLPCSREQDLYPGVSWRTSSPGELLSVAVRARRAATLAERMGRSEGRWGLGVTEGVQVRPILVDPRLDLIGSTDGPVAGDDGIDVTGHGLD